MFASLFGGSRGEALGRKMDMPFLKLLSYFLLLINSFTLASFELDIPTYFNHNCSVNNNFTSNSPYHYNLNDLLVSLYSNATDSDTTPEFSITTAGTTDTSDPDAVYGGFMCRGDVPNEVCKNCIQDATSRIASECPNNKEAIIWYDECFVSYSNRSFFSTLRQLPTVSSELQAAGSITSCALIRSTPCGLSNQGSYMEMNDSNVEPKAYIELNNTLNDAVAEAATSGPAATKKFATKEANFSWRSVYTLTQCTPDLSPQYCSECLHGMMKLIPTEQTPASGRILNPSCNLRFGTERFYYKDDLPPYSAPEFGRPSLTGMNCSTTKANDPYVNNVISLFDNLSRSSNITQNYGFYSTSVGNKSEMVYGLFMCRGDVPLELCHQCVNEGINQLNYFCPSSKEAIIWFDICMFRYSNHSFLSTMDTQPIYTQPGGDMLENQKAGFNRLLTDTLNGLVAATPKKSARVKNFETKKIFSPSELKTLYTLAQCTPNLNSQDCQNCLQDAHQQIRSCCRGKTGGQVMNPSCNLRFETFTFYYDSISAVSEPPAYPPNQSGALKPPAYPPEGKDNDHLRTIIIVVSVTTVVSSMIFCFGFYYWKRKKSKSYKAILKKNFGSEGATLESMQFDFATIEDATDKFSIENRIGRGGFGEVYMGVLPDGSKIAVKRLSKNSSQGLIEFKNEVLLIAKLQHRNLVALLGFCLKDQEKILVYEYVPNKSLDYFLFGSQKPRVLNWPERYKIIGGIARGILYLHEYSRLKIIHRDLKPSNILLDDEMNPKISDFGMARMVGINETRGNTNRIVGTLGYMSPEYIKFGLFSEKSDNFSFGVMVLEIVSGKRNMNSHYKSSESQYPEGLLSNAWKHWRDENLIEILDSNLTEAGTSQSEIIKCTHIGLLCVQGNPEIRPSMNEVVKYLSNDSMHLPAPQEPAFFMHSQMEPAATTREMEDQLANHNYSINEMSKSTLCPR